MKKIAIDLTWVRHQKVGGTESFIRNLLDGFAEIDVEKEGVILALLLTRDNAESFAKYSEFSCFELIVCDVDSYSQAKRVIWQNTRMGKLLRRLNIDTCLEPVYGKPFLGTRKIKFVTVIHDLQAKHYPQYFSCGRVAWMKLSWLNAVKTSTTIVVSSEFVGDDITATYRGSENKIHKIYDPVSLNLEKRSDDNRLVDYGLEKNKFYYTVSSLFLHKNLKTAILAIAELKKRESHAYLPLVVSGIGGRKRDELDELIAQNNLQDDVIFTSYINDSDRNMLYKTCKAFIFSSIFEGFGMPPIEAMAMGTPVLTTRCTSIEEVTGGLVNYVENPLDPIEWADKLEAGLTSPSQDEVDSLLLRYDKRAVAEAYLKLLV